MGFNSAFKALSFVHKRYIIRNGVQRELIIDLLHGVDADSSQLVETSLRTFSIILTSDIFIVIHILFYYSTVNFNYKLYVLDTT